MNDFLYDKTHEWLRSRFLLCCFFQLFVARLRNDSLQLLPVNMKLDRNGSRHVPCFAAVPVELSVLCCACVFSVGPMAADLSRIIDKCGSDNWHLERVTLNLRGPGPVRIFCYKGDEAQISKMFGFQTCEKSELEYSEFVVSLNFYRGHLYIMTTYIRLYNSVNFVNKCALPGKGNMYM